MNSLPYVDSHHVQEMEWTCSKADAKTLESLLIWCAGRKRMKLRNKRTYKPENQLQRHTGFSLANCWATTKYIHYSYSKFLLPLLLVYFYILFLYKVRFPKDRKTTLFCFCRAGNGENIHQYQSIKNRTRFLHDVIVATYLPGVVRCKIYPAKGCCFC